MFEEPFLQDVQWTLEETPETSSSPPLAVPLPRSTIWPWRACFQMHNPWRSSRQVQTATCRTLPPTRKGRGAIQTARQDCFQSIFVIFRHLLSHSINVPCLALKTPLVPVFKGPKPTPNLTTIEKTRLHKMFRKVRANFCLLPCDTSQEPNGNCPEKLVQMNFLILGGFFGWIFRLWVAWGS